MNDDYLWDRSGEPDPEVERLERVLGKYRYQAKPVSPALDSRLSRRRGGWIRLAAVAAAILIVLAGLWIFKIQDRSVSGPIQAVETTPPEKPPDKQATPPLNKRNEIASTATNASGVSGGNHRKAKRETTVEVLPDPHSVFVAERQPMINPFVDVETARHRARPLLLRAFRNTRDTLAQPDPIFHMKAALLGLLSKTSFFDGR
jgi:hypothetical protein